MRHGPIRKLSSRVLRMSQAGVSQPPFVITEQEVVFSTAAAISLPRIKAHRTLVRHADTAVIK